MDSAAIEQMNKLRKSLGLPLIGGGDAGANSSTGEQQSNGPSFRKREDGDSDEEPASTLETREAAGYDNFKKIQNEEKRRTERDLRKKALQKRLDAVARSKKLEGKGLGDTDGNEALDTKSWLKGQNKRQKEIDRERVKRLEEELAERERIAAIQYTSSDLAGVQVAHGINDFEGAEGEQILTLQDREIGKGDDDYDSENGDILENADILARDKLKEKLDSKKKIRYDVHADEAEEGGLLSQYDEKKRKAFTLDQSGSGVEVPEAKRQQTGEKAKNMISLDDIMKPEIVSDYLELKIKKPKKSKKNLRKREASDDDDDRDTPQTTTRSNDGAVGTEDDMQIDDSITESKPKARKFDSTFNDDEDLASALSLSRRAALKKQKRMKPEDLVQRLKEEEEEGQGRNSTPEVEEGGIVLDDTTTFLANLETRPREEQPQPNTQTQSKESIQKSIAKAPSTNVDEDHEMDDAGNDNNDNNQAYTVVEGDEEALLEHLRREQSRHTPEVPAAALGPRGLEEEKTVGEQGLGAVLNLLRSRGLVKAATESDTSRDKNQTYRDRQRFIVEAKLREHETEQRARAQRERDRASGRMAGMSIREREEQARWQNEQRTQKASIEAAAAFNREYKPDVNIKYVDDDGRLMNQKEAFKHLSHQFHGKGSGKQKTEKQLKKVADERRREAKSVLDSSGDGRGMQGASTTMGKRDKVAGVRLA